MATPRKHKRDNTFFNLYSLISHVDSLSEEDREAIIDEILSLIKSPMQDYPTRTKILLEIVLLIKGV